MKVLKLIGKIFAFIGVTLGGILITLVLTIVLICHGPSEAAKELFVTTILETGQVKFLANLFVGTEEIKRIVAKNSLGEMKAEVDTSLIETNVDKTKDLIELYSVGGSNYRGVMMVINDPSKVSLATTYPWTEYGKVLEDLVKDSGAIAGINGGLYYSSGNKGGTPMGICVSNGEIQYLNPYMNGLYIIGFDEANILRIISIEGMSSNQVKELVKKEKIRDAVAFQEDNSDKNNHFVKLIINGEARELNGLGSGANPRTAIGQRADGSVLFFVADGRGADGHLGATASDLIEIFEEYGAVNAANIDGGSSTSMYYKDKYLMNSVTFYYRNSSWRLPTAFVVKEDK